MSTVVSRPDWMADANCLGTNTEQFFQDTLRVESARQATTRALAICRACDVQVECLTYALNIDELDGVWGGMTTEQRRKILRSRARASA